MNRRKSKVLSVLLSLMLVASLASTAALAEGAASDAGQLASGQEVAAMPQDEEQPVADPVEQPEAEPDERPETEPDEQEAAAPEEPTLTPQAAGEIEVGDNLEYKDVESGYWYFYKVLSYDAATMTGTAHLWDVRYIDPDGWYGYSEDLKVEEDYGTVDFTYPTMLLANVTDNSVQSDFPGVTFTVTSLTMDTLPTWRSVYVPATVNELVDEAYLGDYTTRVTFDPDCQITEIPKRFFQYEYKLESVVLPDTVETIGEEAFGRCTFESFVMPENLRSIGDGAFGYCGYLKTIAWNDQLEHIGDNAFRNTMLTELDLPASLLTIGDYAFAKDQNLWLASWVDYFPDFDSEFLFGTVIIPDKVTSIGAYAFAKPDNANNEGLTPITTVRLGKSVEFIGQHAFAESSITSLVLPASLKTIDVDEYGYGTAFLDCALLESVTFDDPEHAQLETMTGFDGCTALKSVVIPPSVKAISPNAFYECSALENVTLPEGVESIGKWAFGVSGLKRIAIPGSVRTVGENAFCGCESLTRVALAEGLETIGDGAFRETPALTSITIPSTVSSIGAGAFKAGNYGGYNYQYNGGGLTSLVIKGGDTPLAIGAQAFALCEGLNGVHIVLPERVASLGPASFLGISNATYDIYNPALRLAVGEGSPSVEVSGLTHDEALAIAGDEELISQEYQKDTYCVFVANPWASDDHPLSMYLPDPNGSVVHYPSTMTAETSPTFMAFLGSVRSSSLQPTFEAFDAAGGYTEPDEPVEVAGAGRLLVTTTGAAGPNALVFVFDADGSLAASAQAASGYAVVEGLDAGTYTVCAVATGAGFTQVGSLSAFSAMGFAASDYARKDDVVIAANADTDVSLSVPKIEVSPVTSTLEGGSIAIAKSSVYLNAEFFATINFKTKSWYPAESLTVTLPKGLTPTSLASVTKTYDISGYDEATRTLTVALDEADTVSGRLWLGLKATTTGRLTVNASVTRGSATEPVGSATTTCTALSLDLPDVPVQGKVFVVGVYAAPRTQVTVTASGTTQTATTNGSGYVAARIDLSEVETTLTYTMVAASVPFGDGVATTSGMVEFETTQTDSHKLRELSFIHAGSKYYVVQHGRPLPKSSYYTYVANGKEENKYWTFEAIYVSDRSLMVGTATSQVVQPAECLLQVQMLDGSSRYQKMTLLRSEQQDDGSYYNYFAASMYLEQAGDHVFPTSLIPYGFDVTLSTPDERLEPTQADITVLREGLYEPLVRYDQRMAERAQQEIAAYVGDDDDTVWDRSVDYSWVFFYDIRVTEIWEYYEEYLTEPEMTQLEEAITSCEEGLSAVGQVFDAIIGAETSISDCGSVTDWVTKNIGYQSGLDFDGETLAGSGWNVTTDTNAPAASTASPTGAGTPTSGISQDTTFVPPAQFATKPNYGTDGGLQSVSYRDSNGNGGTIPIRKISDNIMKDSGSGINWGNVSDMLTHGSIGANTMKDTIDAIDEELKLKIGVDKWNELKPGSASTFFEHAGNVMNVGIYAINQRERVRQSNELENFMTDAAEARGFADNLDIRLNYRIMHGDTSSDCYKALKNERDWAIIVAGGKDSDAHYRVAEVARGELMDWINFTVGTETGPAGSYAIFMLDKSSEAVIADGMDSNKRVLDPALRKLNAAHAVRVANCGDEKLDAQWRLQAILDPSGTVWEAFPENTLDGVTATVYEVGEGDALTQWDAEDYDQVNPEVTGTDGAFAWDVPVGSWQVKLEKEGYETVTTDTMEVPPPRTGLSVGMVSTASPHVTGVTADTSYLEFCFDQWMDAQTIYGVEVNGQSVNELYDGEGVAWANVKRTKVTEDDGVAYWKGFSKTLVAAVPEGTKLGDTLSVKLYGADNYAGKELGEKTFTVKVAARPTYLTFNFDETISLEAGASRPTTVRVYDGDHKPMAGVRLTASLDNSYLATVDDTGAVTDANGEAKLQLEALLPGMSELTVAAEGSSLTRTIALLTTADANQAARPVATLGELSIGEGDAAEQSLTVDWGSTLELSCATEDATIYYTTDGSCPCQNTASRKTYTVPIVITGSTDFIIASYKDGMDYSEKLRLHVQVSGKPDLASAAMTLSATSYTYDGKAKKPTPKVTLAGVTLVAGTDYTVAYANNTDAGTATVTVTGTGGYAGTAEATFKIAQAAQTITAENKECVTKKTVKLGARASGGGKLTYKSAKPNVATVSAKGMVKGVKAGTVKVTITAAATKNYKKAAKTVTVKVGKANTLGAKAKKKSVAIAAGKTAASNVAVTKPVGKVTYKNASTNATAKKFKVAAGTGKITVPKGTKKGTYAIVVTVRAAGNKSTISGTKTVKFKVKVK